MSQQPTDASHRFTCFRQLRSTAEGKNNTGRPVYSQMPLSRKRFRMIDDMLIGSVILDDRMTGQNYLDFLQNELPKQLEDVPLATRIAMYFQHDGAPSHYTDM